MIAVLRDHSPGSTSSVLANTNECFRRAITRTIKHVIRVRAYKFRLLRVFLTVKVKLSAKVPESVLFVL